MFLFSRWLDLPLQVRNEIAFLFGIPKKGSTEVHQNVIKSDGYHIKDIENALTVDAMQRYLDSDETSPEVLLWAVVESVQKNNKNISPLAIAPWVKVPEPKKEVTPKPKRKYAKRKK